jgi:isoleucyl-tRNA synthetase
VDDWKPSKKSKTKRPNVLDRWVLSKLHNLIKLVTQSLDEYDAMTASRAIEDFVVRGFSQWYIRRSRDRVGPTATDKKDKEDFYKTAHEVLTSLVRLMAPFTPFVSEEIYRNLTGDESIHLAPWPACRVGLIDSKLEHDMELGRKIVEEGHSFRKKEGQPLRQPLPPVEHDPVDYSYATSAQLTGNNFGTVSDVIVDELNVEGIRYRKPAPGAPSFEGSIELTDELKAEGRARALVREIQGMRKEKNLELNDRIEVVYRDTKENKEVVGLFGKMIKQKTLAVAIKPGRKLSIRLIGQGR